MSQRLLKEIQISLSKQSQRKEIHELSQRTHSTPLTYLPVSIVIKNQNNLKVLGSETKTQRLI